MINQEETPLLQAIEQHIKKNPVSLHVPGHKNGALYGGDWQEILKYDLTEISGMDDLHHPESVILKSEELLRDAYGARESFFLVGGSTSGNLAMILAALRHGDSAVVARDVHKSVIHALELVGANPIFIEPKKDAVTGTAAGLDPVLLEQVLDANPDVRAVIVTYPNYYGAVFQLDRIVAVAHRYGALALVDEAHGAHFIASDEFPREALRAGADAVVQSAHKTLPALTMGAFLHVNTDKLDVRRYLEMVQSSSPSYMVMASLDVARRYVALYSDEDFKAFWKMRAKWLRFLEKQELEVVCPDDPLKLIVRKKGFSGYRIAEQLEQAGFYPELADAKQVLLILPLLNKGMDFTPFGRIKWGEGDARQGESRMLDLAVPDVSRLWVPYQQMANLETAFLPLDEAAGAVAAENVALYPPGIPGVLRGEKLSERQINYLKQVRGRHFHGGKRLKEGFIEVFL
ncbi:aminotransferase class I/II-fold pyridoxal phosphate-dependent enzyme [Listeria kieliensis]